MRPPALCADDTPHLPVMQHAVAWMRDERRYEADWVMILHAHVAAPAAASTSSSRSRSRSGREPIRSSAWMRCRRISTRCVR